MLDVLDAAAVRRWSDTAVELLEAHRVRDRRPERLPGPRRRHRHQHADDPAALPRAAPPEHDSPTPAALLALAGGAALGARRQLRLHPVPDPARAGRGRADAGRWDGRGASRPGSPPGPPRPAGRRRRRSRARSSPSRRRRGRPPAAAEQPATGRDPRGRRRRRRRGAADAAVCSHPAAAARSWPRPASSTRAGAGCVVLLDALARTVTRPLAAARHAPPPSGPRRRPSRHPPPDADGPEVRGAVPARRPRIGRGRAAAHAVGAG